MPTYLSEDTIQSNERILSLQGLSESEVMERRTNGEGNMAALKTSVAYALGALRIVGKGALVQQANAVESLSNVDVLCLDKTGTVTANAMTFEALSPVDIEEAELRRLLGNYVANLPVSNATSMAIGAACSGQTLPVREEVPFSSARKWSALAIDDPEQRGIYVLGAPEALQPSLRPGTNLQGLVEAGAAHGLRIVLFAFCPKVAAIHGPDGEPQLPAELIPLGLVSVRDILRAEAQETLTGFAQAGIRLKILSGDHPETVAALAKQAGFGSDLRAISGEALADMQDVQLAQQQTLAEHNARIQERARISRDLHDAISQNLFSLRTLIDGLHTAIGAGAETAALQPHIALLEQTTNTMTQEMRALLLEMRPPQLEGLTLAEPSKPWPRPIPRGWASP
jgi:magnesium-transporting ATPase (P-type)